MFIFRIVHFWIGRIVQWFHAIWLNTEVKGSDPQCFKHFYFIDSLPCIYKTALQLFYFFWKIKCRIEAWPNVFLIQFVWNQSGNNRLSSLVSSENSLKMLHVILEVSFGDGFWLFRYRGCRWRKETETEWAVGRQRFTDYRDNEATQTLSTEMCSVSRQTV